MQLGVLKERKKIYMLLKKKTIEQCKKVSLGKRSGREASGGEEVLRCHCHFINVFNFVCLFY